MLIQILRQRNRKRNWQAAKHCHENGQQRYIRLLIIFGRTALGLPEAVNDADERPTCHSGYT